MMSKVHIPGWVLACLVPAVVLGLAKLAGWVSCSWWAVFYPSLALYGLILLVVGVRLATLVKQSRK